MRIQAVVRKGPMKEIDEQEDLRYWLSRSPKERIEALTFIVSQYLKPGQRLDKTAVSKRKLSNGLS
ncbi:hypothetical protein H7F15_03010 [Pontibacter sp. Tf4]|uniref:hypothetical protein n=1 Tax=Pontibacter sp. Tf4 TaxID=2761620 RepID=UPI0016269638|nr:hypothetical protein [Pontibacter sp. Tf4]MBB6609996.1 hypothetical protein [Pontibacter sp. Tf4]